MIDMTITVEGAKELRRAFARAPRIYTRHARRAMTKTVGLGEQKLKAYPPPIAGSSYQRTGTLGRRWTHKVTGLLGGVTGIIHNLTPYGPWVQSEEFQASVHRGRWQTDKRVVKQIQPQVVGFWEDAMEDAVKEIEGAAS